MPRYALISSESLRLADGLPISRIAGSEDIMAVPGDVFIYSHPEGAGFGEAARGEPLTAPMPDASASPASPPASSAKASPSAVVVGFEIRL